jgi:DNA-binding MarR family transcriptional regulator
VTVRVRFYNPREASPEILEAMLVGREGIVREVIDDLARQAGSASRQHWLIRGPRGIGKTHLMGIIYHRVRRDPKLSRAYLPIWLAETEAYSAYSTAVLLIQIAERLAEELGDAASELRAKLQELGSNGDDPALFEEVCAILKEEAHRRGRILLVLMENLDVLLNGLPGARGAREVRRLRSVLSEDRELLFLSTTPTRYLTALSDPDQPLYGHLKERFLQPLTEEEVGLLLERLGEVTGALEKAGIVSNKGDGGIRRRVLHRLTGGNPRAVVMAFSVITGAPGVQAMVEEMGALLDAQTPYFEARLAQLAPRERTIVMAMALAPENLTLQEIAGRSRLPLRSLSTQVDRLIEHGYVAPVEGEGGKGTIYELSDGLFRLWYQYRKGRKALEPIVRFLALWYPAKELERTLAELRNAATNVLALQDRESLSVAILQVEQALHFAASEEGKVLRKRLWSETALAEALSALRSLASLDDNEEWPTRRAGLLGRVGLALLAPEVEAEEQATRLISVVANEPEHTIPDLGFFLSHLAHRFSTERFDAWLGDLETSQNPQVLETARIYRHVLRVLSAGRRPGTGAQQRRELARVPPELRKTVQELVEGILSGKPVRKR